MGALRDIKLISCDLDGTLLLPGGVLGERTKKTLQALAARGFHIAINSGRSPNSVAYFAEQLSLTGPQVALNGAAILQNGTIIDSSPIPSILRERLLDVLHTHGLLPLYFGEHFCAHPELPGPLWNQWAHAWGYESMVDIEAFGDRPMLHLQGLGSAEQTRAAVAAIQYEFGDYIYAWNYPSWFDGPHAIDLVAKGVDKGSGLKRAAALYNVTLAETMACGDWLNDLPMFEVAGRAVAMAHAIDELKTLAAYITKDTHHDEGLASFFEEHWEAHEPPQ
jgi:Cof subfamily protein (haloacid dehalogenase superfamily)